MRAIVLSGGGARGSYQIGVWKALRKLGIKYEIVTGTSVGAFNGALMVQKDYLSAKKIWENMDYKFVFDSEINIDNFVDSLKIYAKEFLDGGGLSVNNLEKNIDKYLKIKKFYNSKIKYGLVTFNSSTMKEKCLTKDDIPKEKLGDYLMASAAPFPAFRPVKIDDQKFIDGGFYDVLPINLAVDLGADEIIAVDLKSWGFRKKLKDKSVKVTFIKPRNKLDMFLRFESDVSKRQMRLGYNDVMKKYDKLCGDKYTFKKWGFEKNIKKFSACNTDLTKKEKINVIENCGEIFELDDSQIYNIKDFNKKIINYINEIKIVDLKKYDLKDIKLKKIRKQVVKYMISNYKGDMAIRIGRLFKKEKLCAEYLRCIRKR